MATSERPPSTGIKVIIVGAGFAGLTAAIECHRKGHEVLVLESFPELKLLGDIISFAPNSGRIFQRWPGVDEKLDPIIHKSDGLLIKTWKGEDVTRQTWDKEAVRYGKAYNGHVRMFELSNPCSCECVPRSLDKHHRFLDVGNADRLSEEKSMR